MMEWCGAVFQFFSINIIIRSSDIQFQKLYYSTMHQSQIYAYIQHIIDDKSFFQFMYFDSSTENFLCEMDFCKIYGFSITVQKSEFDSSCMTALQQSILWKSNKFCQSLTRFQDRWMLSNNGNFFPDFGCQNITVRILPDMSITWNELSDFAFWVLLVEYHITRK